MTTILTRDVNHAQFGLLPQVGGQQDARPVDSKRAHDNLAQFATAILDTKNEIDRAIKNPNPAEQFLKKASNERLARDSVTQLNLAFKALKGWLPPVVKPEAPLVGPAPGHPVMMYGVFLFNRINDALNKIHEEIATMKAALKDNKVSDADEKKIRTAVADLEKAQKDLKKIHQRLAPFAANPG